MWALDAKNNSGAAAELPSGSAHARRPSVLTDLTVAAANDICAALNGPLSETFALYLKKKSFHWRVSRPHFHDYHFLLDERGDQIFAMTDPIAERARKIGGPMLRSVGHIARMQRIADNGSRFVEPRDMLAKLRDDNLRLTSARRRVHDACEEYGDFSLRRA